MPNDDYITVKLPVETGDPNLSNGEELRREKNDLGVSWLEYVNGQAPDIGVDGETIREAIGAADAEVDGDAVDTAAVVGAVQEAVRRSLEDAMIDLQQEAYQGAREGVQEVMQDSRGGL